MIRSRAATTLAVASGGMLWLTGPTNAQQSYGPTELEETDGSAPETMLEEKPCEDVVQEDGTIVVCRELDDGEEYMSPVPRPIDGNRGLRLPPDVSTLPPCVHAPPLQFCASGLGAPSRPIPMVDFGAFPEPLTPAEAARVYRAEDLAAGTSESPD